MRYYYFEQDTKALGPYTLEELKSKKITMNTLVWTDGMEQWATADSLKELKELLVSTPPPIPSALLNNGSESIGKGKGDSSHTICKNQEKLEAFIEYRAVEIGQQIWMAENLNVDRFRNGEPITEAKTDEEWKRAGENKQPAWCYYENDPSNGKMFGKLYNWYAVNDPRGLAPEGWRIPSDDQWTQLTDTLGGEEVAGTRMKSKSGWDEGDKGNNETGYSALPGGARYCSGSFRRVGSFGFWWSATEKTSLNAWRRYMFYNSGIVSRVSNDKANGFSVRCLKDSD